MSKNGNDCPPHIEPHAWAWMGETDRQEILKAMLDAGAEDLEAEEVAS